MSRSESTIEDEINVWKRNRRDPGDSVNVWNEIDEDADSQDARDQSSSMSRSESTIEEDPLVERRKDSARDFYEIEVQQTFKKQQ